MKRHHEIMLYRMRAKENGAAVCDERDVPPLDRLTASAKVTETMSEGAYQEATKQLREMERELTELRDYWIRAYLGTDPLLTARCTTGALLDDHQKVSMNC